MSKELLPYFYQHANHEELVFTLNGAPSLVTRVTKNCIKDIDLRMLNCTPNSLDLYPIENMWIICKDRVQKMKSPKTKRANVECSTSSWGEHTDGDVRQVGCKHKKKDTSCN